MSLIKCPECGREISDKAVSCPGCGYPFAEFTSLEKRREEYLLCPFCGEKYVNGEDYCPVCGMLISSFKNDDILHEKIPNEPYTICSKCGKYNKVGVFKCERCGHHCLMSEYNIINPEKHVFNGIFRYTLFGEKQEVYCPRCGSENCSHYQEQKMIPGKKKTRYTVNINPLRLLTFANKKEKVIKKDQFVTVSKFVCNSCGKIFK